MRSRPSSVTVAAILLALFSLSNAPWPWFALSPEAQDAPVFVIFWANVLGILGIAVAVGLWTMKKGGYWATIMVCVINILLNVAWLALVSSAALLAAIAVQIVGFALIAVLVVLPGSRRAFTAT